jgi:predicted ABC-type ATPase
LTPPLRAARIARLLAALKQDGYRVLLYFLWLPTADQAVNRVANRVRQGGHPVPEIDVRRRFGSGLKNFFLLYRPVAQAWWFYDASVLPPALIAREEDGLIAIAQPNLFAAIPQNMGE